MIRFLTHHRTTLALHELRSGVGHPLLLLHGLGEQSPTSIPALVNEVWPGPVFALDFTGHGQSTMPVGGGYSAEVLMADADTALAEIGPATVLGRGLGAYIALLIAGARPELVLGAILCDGPGMTGGPTGPSSASLVDTPRGHIGPPDPWALVELSRDVRPGDYAASFARHAVESSAVNEPITVCARWHPEWLKATLDQHGVVDTSLDRALANYARR